MRSGCLPLSFGLLDLAVEALESVREAAHLVDDAQGHCLLSIDHTANVGGHIVLFQHQGLELLSRDLAVAGDEGHDPILKPLEVVVGLGGGDDRAAHADRVDGHGGAGDGKAPSGSHCQRHADGMASSQDDGDRRLCHAGDQLRDGKARLHVAAHGIQQEEDAVHMMGKLLLRFLNCTMMGMKLENYLLTLLCHCRHCLRIHYRAN